MTQTTGADQLRTAAARLNASHDNLRRLPKQPPQATPEQIRSQAVHERFDKLDLTREELNFLAGWLMSTAPDAVDDALDAVEIFHNTRKV